MSSGGLLVALLFEVSEPACFAAHIDFGGLGGALEDVVDNIVVLAGGHGDPGQLDLAFLRHRHGRRRRGLARRHLLGDFLDLFGHNEQGRAGGADDQEGGDGHASQPTEGHARLRCGDRRFLRLGLAFLFRGNDLFLFVLHVLGYFGFLVVVNSRFLLHLRLRGLLVLVGIEGGFRFVCIDRRGRVFAGRLYSGLGFFIERLGRFGLIVENLGGFLVGVERHRLVGVPGFGGFGLLDLLIGAEQLLQIGFVVHGARLRLLVFLAVFFLADDRLVGGLEFGERLFIHVGGVVFHFFGRLDDAFVGIPQVFEDFVEFDAGGFLGGGFFFLGLQVEPRLEGLGNLVDAG